MKSLSTCLIATLILLANAARGQEETQSPANLDAHPQFLETGKWWNLFFASVKWRVPMTNVMHRFACTLAALAVVSIASEAEATTIDMNATIDYVTDDTDTIVVADSNPNPPTIVEIVDPARIRADLVIRDNSVVRILGGTTSEFVRAFDQSMVFVSGGVLTEELVLSNDSRATVSGGLLDDMILGGRTYLRMTGADDFGEITAADNARVDLSGGMNTSPATTGFTASGQSRFRIFGSGFNYPLGPIPDAAGTLTGVLRNGDPLEAQFSIADAASIELVPEPTSWALAMLAAGGLLAAARRRRTAPLAEREPRRNSPPHTA